MRTYPLGTKLPTKALCWGKKRRREERARGREGKKMKEGMGIREEEWGEEVQG